MRKNRPCRRGRTLLTRFATPQVVEAWWLKQVCRDREVKTGQEGVGRPGSHATNACRSWRIAVRKSAVSVVRANKGVDRLDKVRVAATAWACSSMVRADRS